MVNYQKHKKHSRYLILVNDILNNLSTLLVNFHCKQRETMGAGQQRLPVGYPSLGTYIIGCHFALHMTHSCHSVDCTHYEIT